MKVNSVVIKLGSTIMVLFLVVLLPFGFFIDHVFLQIYSTQVQQDTNELSKNLTNTLDKLPKSGSEFYEYLNLISGKEIVVINEDGIIISNSVFEYSKGEPMPHELISILKEGMHVERDYTNPETGEQFFFVGRPIIQNET